MNPDLHIDDLERQVDAYCIGTDAVIVGIDAKRLELEQDQRRLRERLDRLERIGEKMRAAEKRVHDKYPELFGAAGVVLMAHAIRSGLPNGKSEVPDGT